MTNKLKALVECEINSISNIPLDGKIEEAVELIYQKVHQEGGKVVVSGVGKAGYVGRAISSTFCSTGTASVFLDALDSQHGDLGVLQKNDVLFLISNSGMTREIIELAELSLALFPQLTIILLSKNPDSPLSKIAHICVLTGSPEEICPLGLTPTTSTTVMGVVGDLIVVLLLEKIGFTKEMYAARHHGGYLGKKARQ
ncbi:MAG: SIS domain-containing protein [Bacteroidota bacterium]